MDLKTENQVVSGETLLLVTPSVLFSSLLLPGRDPLSIH